MYLSPKMYSSMFWFERLNRLEALENHARLGLGESVDMTLDHGRILIAVHGVGETTPVDH